MARILVNKHFSNSNEIKETIFDALHGKGEIIISNEVGSEGLYIMNDSGVIVNVTDNDLEDLKEAISSVSAYTDTRIEEIKDLIQNKKVYTHQPLTYDQYTELITNGTIEITDENGVTNTIVYDDNTFYAIYE